MLDDVTAPSRIHVIVEGRVQGVGFRYFVHEKAQELGIKGWVRNLYLRNVEVVAEGSRNTLEQLLEYLNDGPSSADVVNVKVEWQPPSGEFYSFSVR